MIAHLKDIRTIDVLYRVSTIGQELEGESLFVQRESVEEKWAKPNGITVRRRIVCTESGKSALKLKGAGFQFNRRAEYTDLILEYQRMSRAQLPDAVVVDWYERWSRFPLEMLGLIEAFSALGIRMLAIGDQLELTDPKQRLLTTIKSAVANEQLRVTAEKVREVKASRRSRAVWQGGPPPDGYRSHAPECDGLVSVARETPDGEKKVYRVRACSCPNGVLQRDPRREATIVAIWERLERSAGSFHEIAAEIKAAGYRTPSGKPFGWNQIYRLGQNPHYAGIFAYDRFVRDPHDGTTLSVRPLNEQMLVPAGVAIPHPYVSADVFWKIQERYLHTGRKVAGLRRGATNELYGLLFCGHCGRRMASYTKLSNPKTGHGHPRRSPRITRRYAVCTAQGCPAFAHRGYVDIDRFGKALVQQLADLVQLDDNALATALKLQRAGKSVTALSRQRTELEAKLRAASNARHVLIGDRAASRISQKEYEAELFAFRRDAADFEERLRVVDAELGLRQAKPTFGPARMAVNWLADSWEHLTIAERAEALRLLVARVTFDTTDREPAVTEWGSAFKRASERIRARA